MQGRLFGASASDWRFFVEATFGGADGQPSDAFSAAYPYDGRLRPMEIYGEKMFRPRNRLLGVRGGRYRTPFGLSSRGDHAYTGFTRAPLIRYGDSFALSNTYMEGGVSVIAGSPRLYAETSLGVPQDEGSPAAQAGARRQRPRAGVLQVPDRRRQPHPHRPRQVARQFCGGARGLQRRRRPLDRPAACSCGGNGSSGIPSTGSPHDGGYLDLIVHRIGMGPVTAVARAERLDYDALVAALSLVPPSVHRRRPRPLVRRA